MKKYRSWHRKCSNILDFLKIKSLGKQKEHQKNIMKPIQSSGLLVTLPLVNKKSKITFVFKTLSTATVRQI
jgi:hypothetical protein